MMGGNWDSYKTPFQIFYYNLKQTSKRVYRQRVKMQNALLRRKICVSLFYEAEDTGRLHDTLFLQYW